MPVVLSSSLEADVGALLETRVGDQPTYYSEICLQKKNLLEANRGNFEDFVP